MSLAQPLHELHGLPAYDFPGPGATSELPAADAVAWRIHVDIPSADEEGTPDDEEGAAGADFAAAFERFLTTVDASRVRALIVGWWGGSAERDSGDAIARIAAARDRLTSLRAVFVGDVADERITFSRIRQADVTPLLAAYPELRELGVRGGSGLEFPAVGHTRLRTLSFESSGLPASVVRGVAASELPALEYLEMWLGTPEYGGDATVADLAPILDGERLPELSHLGLQNSGIQDEFAAAVATAPVVRQLDSLELSMGVLTDEGGEALLKGTR
ncbi:STM4015 family protein [Streptomyces sp. M19]